MSPSSRLVLATILLAAALLAIAGALGTAGGPATVATASAAAASEEPRSPTPAPSDVASSSAPRPTASAARPDAGDQLTTLIARLPVAEEQRAGYDRSLFHLWIDADGDGCDTRQEVLIADAIVAPTVGARCSLTGGEWISPYDGRRVSDSRKLDIDHVVPLAEAWHSGAYAWTAARREAFANDLGVPWALLAVFAGSNRAKGDRDPAEWLPPLVSDRCEYVVDWVAVKVRWQLAIDDAEREALLELSSSCGAARVPVIPAP